MVKKSPKSTHKNHFKAFSRPFLMFCLVCITLILCVNPILAFDRDNSKSYDSDKREVTITNLFGFGEELFRARLITPDVVRVIDRGAGIFQKVGEYEITNMDKKDFKNTFGKVHVYNRKNMKKQSREVVYKYRNVVGSYSYPITETDCDGCTPRVVDTNYVERVEWVDFKKFSDLPEGDITIGVFIDVFPGEEGEWQPTFYGMLVPEWAGWSSNLSRDILSYWTFNETSGVEAVDAINGTYNGSIEDAVVNAAGKIGTSFNFSASATANVSFDNNMMNGVNLTISLWVKPEKNQDNAYIWSYVDSGDSDPEIIIRHLSDASGIEGKVAGNALVSSVNLSREDWSHIVFQFDTVGDGNASLWINGSLVAVDETIASGMQTTATHNAVGDSIGNVMQGTIDEVSWWNRYLTPDEILDLWNDGDGITYLEGIGLQVTLTDPSNGTVVFKGEPADFNFSTSSTSELVNATLYLNGAVTNNEVNITGTNNVSGFITDLSAVANGVVNWSVEVCDIVECLLNLSDSRDIILEPIKQTDVSFINNTLEGATVLFEINVTTDGTRLTTADLIYNNSLFSGTFSETATNNFSISTTLNVEGITADANMSFFWNITLEDGFLFQSQEFNQSVENIGIDDCSTFNTILLNLSLRDEETQDLVNVSRDNSTVEVDLDIFPISSTTSIVNFSGNFSENDNPQICLNLNITNVTYVMDTEIRYDADGYAAEFYHLQNASVTNSTIPFNISLLDLLDTSATQFLVTFKDENFVPVADALIDIQRKYTADGVFKSVEIPKTDEDGQATASFQLEGALYTIIVIKFGEILATFTNIAVYCDDKVIEDCRINLNALSSGVAFTNWTNKEGVSTTTSFNSTNRSITSIFTSTDGSTKSILLNATKFDRFGNTTVCSDTLTSSSGTLICNIPSSYGNVTVVSTISVDGVVISTDTYTIVPTAADRFGTDGAAMLLLMMLIIPLMLISNVFGVIIGTIVGLIIGAMLGVYTNFNMIGSGAILIFAIISGGILIWKISRMQ